ncbi:acyl carrier protein [Corynebacterium sp. sy039]|uniref:acyl carrier protein n=1 Tax=Corynebacterium sp. sy039 TaxID=2599641 RepID=UPI0011B8180D|nr:acyl carrier protein [Corynebacterium sp. sy039]QDZ42994.1 acyl carrier protein [Corynebacterium sp. sy039]
MASLQEQLAKLQSTQDSDARTAQPTTAQKIRTIIARVLGEEPESIATSTLLQDLGASSLDIIEIAVRLEIEFPQQLRSDKVRATMSIADLAVLIDATQG